MSIQLSAIKPGLAIVLFGLAFGIALSIGFGLNEDAFKDFIAEGIAAHPAVHDAKSQDKVWRYAQRAHFHSTGIAAFSIGLLLLVSISNLRQKLKKATSVLIGLGSFYPFGWLTMFLLAPSIGRSSFRFRPPAPCRNSATASHHLQRHCLPGLMQKLNLLRKNPSNLSSMMQLMHPMNMLEHCTILPLPSSFRAIMSQQFKIIRIRLYSYNDMRELREHIRDWMDFYNHERMHQHLDYTTPWSNYKQPLNHEAEKAA